jgi:DNA-binding Lrp family transcriptional regulator
MEFRSQMEDERPKESHHQEGAIVDQLDKRILARLLVEGRISYRQMAQELHTSTSTVSSRVSKLEKSGLITGFSVNVNYEALGYDLTAVTEFGVSKGKLSQTERDIAMIPGVCAVYDVTGVNDGIVVAKFKRREELSRFVKHILSMPFVERANTHVVLATVKEDFRVPL